MPDSPTVLQIGTTAPLTADQISDQHADLFLQLKPGTDVALYNGIMHEIIRLGLVDREFVARRTSNYDALAKTVEAYPPDLAARITALRERSRARS